MNSVVATGLRSEMSGSAILIPEPGLAAPAPSILSQNDAECEVEDESWLDPGRVKWRANTYIFFAVTTTVFV